MDEFANIFDLLTPGMAIICFALPVLIAIGDLRMRRNGRKLSGEVFISRIRLFGLAPLLGLSALLMFTIDHSDEQLAQSLSDGAFIGGIGYGVVVFISITLTRMILYRRQQ